MLTAKKILIITILIHLIRKIRGSEEGKEKIKGLRDFLVKIYDFLIQIGNIFPFLSKGSSDTIVIPITKTTEEEKKKEDSGE